MSSVDDTSLSTDYFYVWKYDTEVSEICVLVRTNDGLYDANMKFNIAKFERGFVKLSWPTQYAAKLKRYKRSEISLIGTVGNKCNLNGNLLVCSFSQEVKSVELLTFFLKTNGRMTFIASDPSTGENEKVTCSRLEGNQKKSVNCRCDVPLKYFKYGRQYFLSQSTEGESLGTTNNYKLKIRL